MTPHSSCKPGMHRRRFTQRCLAMAAGGIGSSLIQLNLTQSLLAQSSSEDTRALVCLFLDGGNDSFNMLLPYETSEYADYLSIRQDQSNGGLALPREQLLPIVTPGGRSFGLHPAMAEMQQLYNNGDLAFVANVGSLIEPTDYSDYQDRNQLPLGLFSHADLIRHWQTSLPQSRSESIGWGGRVADILTDPSRRNDPIPMSISMDRVNTFQTGVHVNPYIINSGGATEFESYSSNWGPDLIVQSVLNQVLARDETDLMHQTYNRLTRQAIDAAAMYNAAANAISFETVFPQSYFGRSMERIARTIASAGALNHQRQIFFIAYGGWDHHGDLIGPQNTMLADVSSTLGAFHACLTELQLADQVVTFSASDFGRTLAGNGQGSDHGWGGNQFVMGGPVTGGDVFGEYPISLASGNPLDVGRGRLIPTLSVDQYAAELVMWMGIGNHAELETILPNIRNFYPSTATDAPIGFLGN